MTPYGAFCDGKGLASKKSVAASEQERPDVARRRAIWKRFQARLAPERLVFLDETWTKTNMSPLRGWRRRGERLHAKVPHGHWKTLTFVAALRCGGIDAPCVFDGPINGESDPDAIIRDGRRLDHAEGASRSLRARPEPQPRGAKVHGNRPIDQAEAAGRFIAALGADRDGAACPRDRSTFGCPGALSKAALIW